MSSKSGTKWSREFNDEEGFPLMYQDSSNVFCKVCERTPAQTQKYQQQHIHTEKHKMKSSLKERRAARLLLRPNWRTTSNHSSKKDQVSDHGNTVVGGRRPPWSSWPPRPPPHLCSSWRSQCFTISWKETWEWRSPSSPQGARMTVCCQLVLSQVMNQRRGKLIWKSVMQ